NGSPVKQREMQELGVRVINWGQNFDETPFAAHLYARSQGARFVHPYASMADVAATGILGLEIARRYPETTDVVTQVGGSSLHSGVSSVVSKLLPGTRFTLGQTAGCSPYVDTLLSGEVQTATDIRRGGRSYFSKLGGVGVGKIHPFTLGIGSQHVDAAHRVYPDHVYATMHDYREEHGVLPEFAAAVGLETARELARTSGVRGARIIAILTGNRAEDYPPSYLESLSDRRREEEHYHGRGSSIHAFS
ncbi:MAG TPA: pyridoxal-phosphate dependent enzyme, partial [Candidatus Saccharimonadales bacterium]